MSIASSREAAVATGRPDPDDPAERLTALRAELDGVDDALHDLLMRRAELVVQVGALRAKGPVPLRPGREAAILRRLAGRNRGALAPATLVRVWRELLSGSLAQQGMARVLVGDGALLPAVREHFGALTTAETVEPTAAIDAVAAGRATLAVLPWPMTGWWTALLEGERWRRVHVVARLPFWARAGAPEAVVLSAAAPDPSGQDRTLLAVAGANGPVLAERAGFLTEVEGATVLGAYAIPMGAER